MNPVEVLTNMAVETGSIRLAAPILCDERFPIWSGSSKKEQHHYGKGGLAQHTMEVAQLCLKNAEYFKTTLNKPVDTLLLFIAALYHDVGKMWDYEPQPEWNQPLLPTGAIAQYVEWQGNDHKRNIHHISRSVLTLSTNNYKLNFLSQDKEDQVVHAILSHHGLREWGSPVAPNSEIAWLLHLCDNMSARMNDFRTSDQFSVKKG